MEALPGKGFLEKNPIVILFAFSKVGTQSDAFKMLGINAIQCSGGQVCPLEDVVFTRLDPTDLRCPGAADSIEAVSPTKAQN